MMISIMIGIVFFSIQFYFHSTFSPFGLKWFFLLIFFIIYFFYLIWFVMCCSNKSFIVYQGRRHYVNVLPAYGRIICILYVVCSVFVLLFILIRRQRKMKYKYLISKKNPPNVRMEHGIDWLGSRCTYIFYLFELI